jgi:hypothetical protein
MRIFIPVIMIFLFGAYVLYLALVKKDLKNNLQTIVYPGVFFIVIWIGCYFLFLR